MAQPHYPLSVSALVFLATAAILPPPARSLQTTNWAARLESSSEKETVTNLHFYFHDTLSGSNPSAVKVAQAPATSTSLTLFGSIMMADDPLTETPDPKSKLVGRAQGLYGSAGKEEISLIMAMTYSFVDGPYKDSSLSLLGRNQALNPTREMAVIGGTGVFRMARGYAIAKTNWMNPLTGDAIVGYNVTVFH